MLWICSGMTVIVHFQNVFDVLEVLKLESSWLLVLLARWTNGCIRGQVDNVRLSWKLKRDADIP
jgi:hypothetical protein